MESIISLKFTPSYKDFFSAILQKTTRRIRQTYYRKFYGRFCIAADVRLKPIISFTWFGASTIATLFIAVFLLIYFSNPVKLTQFKYSIFASKPFVLGSSSERILSADARAAALEGVLKHFDCPMQGMGKVFVREADKNGIPYWIVPAISFQESNCGKKTPEKNGVESFNGWGWGVWGDNVMFFENWEHGIETVSKYLSDRFFSNGVTDPCEIMKVYTPPSKGSWCNGVNYFKEVITEYESQQE